MAQTLTKRETADLRAEFTTNAVKAAALVQSWFTAGDGEHLPVVERLWEMFNDTDVNEKGLPLVPVAEKVKIAKFFAEVAQQQSLMALSLGLATKDQAQPATTIVNLQVNADQPPEERLKAIEAFVAGTPLVGDAD